MSSPTVSFQEGKLVIDGPFTDAMALQAEENLSVMCGYYQHRLIRVVISSPGGDASALRYMLDVFERLRGQGVCIETGVTFKAMSAGALLLSLGEVGSRHARRRSSLLFHHPRIFAKDQAITAGTAAEIAGFLHMNGREMVETIVAHLCTAYGGTAELAAAGAGRTELLENRWQEIGQQLQLANPSAVPVWKKQVEQTWAKCIRTGKLNQYSAHLMRRFNEDTTMDLREAYALHLIDKIDLVRALEMPLETDKPGDNRLHRRAA
jgi:ATP-dependent protease ClpP protease subunit